ncbi:MAG: transcriptional repressor [Reichenbachiella sp.]
MNNSRKTTSKVAILELLQRSEGALSHKEIMSALDGLCDRVTVYRVLERLIQENYLHQVMDVDGVKRFATCTDCTEHHHHNHVHFSCTKCAIVTCLDDIRPQMKIPNGYVVKESVFTLSGVCPNCSSEA